MRVLAIETSTEHCSCALWHAGAAVESLVNAGSTHSSLLLPMLMGLLHEAGSTLAAVDAIAFGAGPGSFTGVRIACSVAQGLGFARGLPLVPVVTLKALAEEAGHAQVLACLDARMGELYLAAYERANGQWRTVLRPMLARPDALPALSGRWHASGSGLKVHAAALNLAYDLASCDAAAFPRARAIAALGARALAAGKFVAAEAAAPLYLRNKIALDVREQALARAARVTT